MDITLPSAVQAPPESPREAATVATAPPPLDDPAPTWAARWLGPLSPVSWTLELRRLALGVALSSLFGLALGLRQGGVHLLLCALGAPAGIAAVVAFAVPAFAIVLALADAPVEGLDLARAASRAAAKAGFLLAGLAPGAALLVVTCEDAITITVGRAGVLLLAGAVAARSFAGDLGPLLAGASPRTRAVLAVALPLFLLFAAVLAARVWWLALPEVS